MLLCFHSCRAVTRDKGHCCFASTRAKLRILCLTSTTVGLFITLSTTDGRRIPRAYARSPYPTQCHSLLCILMYHAAHIIRFPLEQYCCHARIPRVRRNTPPHPLAPAIQFAPPTGLPPPTPHTPVELMVLICGLPTVCVIRCLGPLCDNA